MNDFSQGLKFAETENGCILMGIGSCVDKDVVIPSECDGMPVIAIAPKAFYRQRIGFSQIESIHIPDTVTSIGEGAFWGCTSLKSVYIPNNVHILEPNVFRRCVSLKEVNLPEGLLYIGNFAFSECRALERISIPYGVVAIGQDAFQRCDSLANVQLPDSVSSIGDYAFNDCTSLGFFCIPNGVLKINKGVFNRCTSLKDIVIPFNVKYIDCTAFKDCSNLLHVCYTASSLEWKRIELDYPEGNLDRSMVYFYSEDVPWDNANYWCFTNDGQIGIWGDSDVVGCSAKKNKHDDVEKPDSNEMYDEIEFSYYKLKLRKCKDGFAVSKAIFFHTCQLVSIPIEYNGLKITRIDEHAFLGCHFFEYIFIPESIKSIGFKAFANCDQFKYILYDGSVEDWRHVEICFGDDSIQSLTVFYSVEKEPEHDVNYWEYYEDKNFYNCIIVSSDLCDDSPENSDEESENNELDYMETANGFVVKGLGSCPDGNIVIPSRIRDKPVVGIADNAFRNCSIVSVSIPDSVTSIGEAAFCNCNKLVNVSFLGCIKNIGEAAFEDCVSLVKFDIPGGLTIINRETFYGCKNLKFVKIPEGVTEIGELAFGECESLKGMILPKSIRNAYKNAFSRQDAFYRKSVINWK